MAQSELKTNGSAQQLSFNPEPPPLRLDEGGVIRIAKSRVNLDLIVEQYENGATPEDIVAAFGTLALADVYGAVAYYLKNRDNVRTYLARRQREAEVLRADIEAKHPRVTRAELLARRAAREKDHAAAGK